MKTKSWFLPGLTLACLSAFAPLTRAQSVQASGNVSPFPDPNPTTAWEIYSEIITIGGSADGALTISAGDYVFHNGAPGYLGSTHTGTLTVTGSDSRWSSGDSNFYVGVNGGVGIMNITDGGAVDQESVYLAQGVNSTGTVTVDGANSNWATWSLYLGDSGGHGTLTIRNQGSVDSTYAYLGWGYSTAARGDVSIDGSSSAWRISQSLIVGVGDEDEEGTGEDYTDASTVTITNGGSVAVEYSSTIGQNADAKGMVSVAGTGSTLTVGTNQIIGSQGEGTLALSDGGSATIGEYASVAQSAGSSGSVTLTGLDSAWSITGNLDLGGYYYNDNSQGAGGTASLDVSGTGSVSSGGTLRTWSGSTISLRGGTLSAAAMDFSRGGALAFTLIGPSAEEGDYGSITATGGITFGGVLNVTVDGYTPRAGDSFDLFNYTTATGAFASINLAALDTGLTWDTSQLYTTGTLGVTAVPEPAASALLLGFALLAWAVLRRRARQSKEPNQRVSPRQCLS